MAEFWDLLTYLWDCCFNFLNTSIVTIGSVEISLWQFALGFVLLGMIFYFFSIFMSD